jgi:hypothetical protein
MTLHLRAAPLILAIALVLPVAARSGEHGGGRRCSCTDPAACGPACKATWDEVTTTQPAYSMKCEYACARGSDCWCAGKPECRCTPPCGKVIVKKRLYKGEGEEKVERVPKYEVVSAPMESCDCARCQGVCFWNPLAVLHYLLHH